MNQGSFNPIADEGVYTVGRIFNRDFLWAFRPQPIADMGIDAHVEVCKDGKPLGQIIALQIKSGESYFQTEINEGYVYRGELKHLHYWLNYPLPVLLALYHPVFEQVFWEVVTKEKIEFTKKGWKIVIPYKQYLNKSALPKILALLNNQINIKLPEDYLIQEIIEETNFLKSLPPWKVVGYDELEKLAIGTRIKSKEKIRAFTKDMFYNNIDFREWQIHMANEIKYVVIIHYLLAKGGLKAIEENDYSRLTKILKQQFQFLHLFAVDIKQGRFRKSDLPELIERSTIFIDCSIVAFEMAKARNAELELIYIRDDNNQWKTKLLKS
ncbi:DUF4365 domain-containing protein [Nostoc sp. FACHB-190]|uniref:DUF4365 domain-containing protein n=1 Tax=Nostoc sp. FACHB-190 TaxID=2692838 RepID=UPI001687DB75|nr:DUF4365 domain-containing protein [Nostoc sp. FACHB-190]MBD2303847.1 DUF4365 domain-containing protein [Nostoc sp. FACHB-190]